MLKEDIDFDVISRERQSLMGIAILWIYLFHSQFAMGIPILSGIVGFGSHGVDMFFFLSAFGLSYSLAKNDGLKNFYTRRIVRIYPTYLLVLVIVHVAGMALNYPHPSTLFQNVCWYSTIGWWINGFVSPPYCYFYEWYIPTLMVFYLFAPYLYRRSSIELSIIILAAIMISISFSYYGVLPWLYWSFQRIAVYISGFLFFKLLKVENKKLINAFLISIGIMGGAILICLINHSIDAGNTIFQLSLYRCFMVFSMPLLLWIVVKMVLCLRITKLLFSFLGGLSLEIYLIHIYNRPLALVRSLLLSDMTLSIFINLILVSAVAYILHVLIEYLTGKVMKRERSYGRIS